MNIDKRTIGFALTAGVAAFFPIAVYGGLFMDITHLGKPALLLLVLPVVLIILACIEDKGGTPTLSMFVAVFGFLLTVFLILSGMDTLRLLGHEFASHIGNGDPHPGIGGCLAGISYGGACAGLYFRRSGKHSQDDGTEPRQPDSASSHADA